VPHASRLHGHPSILASLVTRERVAGHLHFDISTFLEHAFMACGAKAGAFVEAPGNAVGLDDFEKDLRGADFGGPGLERRYQGMRCACAPESRVHHMAIK